MDRAGALYGQGDVEGALQTYERVEQRIRAHGALRIIPTRDRQNLFLNEARLLYAMEKYDEAADRLAKEDEISGATTDARFFLLRGNIVYRRAFKSYQEAAPKVFTNYTPKKDQHLLEENLLGAEDSFRESLRLDPDDWDAKYNFEFVASVRKNLAASAPEKLRLLEKAEQPETKELPPESAG
jgi:tetratricopeptide (TPR) repeat protein